MQLTFAKIKISKKTMLGHPLDTIEWYECKIN